MSAAWRLIFLSSILFISCTDPDDSPSPTDDDTIPEGIDYIYLSHTRTADNTSIFSKVYDINFSKFEMKLLGGDLAWNSFSDNEIITLLDDVFDLSNEKTLFSVGNHEIVSDEKFRIITGKAKYNLHQQDDISFVTLDTERDLGFIRDDQKIFFDTVMDTITTKNIVILSHKLIFMVDHPVMDNLISDVSNGPMGNCSYCLGPSNFQNELYPKLVEARDRDKNIYWIAGDLGTKTSSFEYLDENGIQFLGNGIGYESSDNEVLVLINDDSDLYFRFQDLDEFIANQ
jgi:hypothetical protein